MFLNGMLLNEISLNGVFLRFIIAPSVSLNGFDGEVKFSSLSYSEYFIARQW